MLVDSPVEKQIDVYCRAKSDAGERQDAGKGENEDATSAFDDVIREFAGLLACPPKHSAEAKRKAEFVLSELEAVSELKPTRDEALMRLWFEKIAHGF